MSFVSLTPTEPGIKSDADNVQSQNASTFRNNLNAYVGAIEDKAQLSQAFLEKLQSLVGNGFLSGGTPTIGTGLSLNVATFQAFCGNAVETSGSIAVGLDTTTAGTYRLYLRQNRAARWTWRLVGAGVPTDTATNGAYLAVATVVSNGTSLSSLVDERVMLDAGPYLSRNSLKLENGGAAPITGSATLVAGTVTVSTTAASATALIFLSVATAGGTIGTLTYTKSAGVSFTITSSSSSDTSVVNWMIVEPV